MILAKPLLCFGLILFLVLSTAVPSVKAWEKADFEIFDLVDELEKSEGKDTNFYNWLQVKPSATQAQVSKAYRKLSIQLHPDKNKHDAKAEERFARLGKVASILRNAATRERYNHFYKNGVPRWRGTGYYYARFRPGVVSVVVFIMVLAAGMQYMVKWINFYQEKRKILQFVQDARANLNVSVPKGYGAPTLGRSYLDLGHRTFRCEIKSDTYIIIHTDKTEDSEPVHLNTEWVMPPRPTDIYLLQWPLQIVNKLIGKKTDDIDNSNHADAQDSDNTTDDQGGNNDKKKPLDKKKKTKSDPVNVTGTKVGGRRRAVRK